MKQPRSFRAEAVVLRHSDWGEADRLLTLFTREAGKTRAIAKGARKIRSRKAGHLEPFTRVCLMLARGRDHEVFDRAIDVQVSLLRKLIEPDPANPRFIQTVWGFGYVYVPDLASPADDAPPAAARDGEGTS